MLRLRDTAAHAPQGCRDSPHSLPDLSIITRGNNIVFLLGKQQGKQIVGIPRISDPCGTSTTKTIVSSPRLLLKEVLLATSEGPMSDNSISLQRGSSPLCVILLASFPHKQYFNWIFGLCDIYLERKISSVFKPFKPDFLFRSLIWDRVHGLSPNAKELSTKQGISELQRGAMWGQANLLVPLSLCILRDFNSA